MLPPSTMAQFSLMWSLECIRLFDVVVFSLLPPLFALSLGETLVLSNSVKSFLSTAYRGWELSEVVPVEVQHLQRAHLKQGGRDTVQHVVKQQQLCHKLQSGWRQGSCSIIKFS